MIHIPKAHNVLDESGEVITTDDDDDDDDDTAEDVTTEKDDCRNTYNKWSRYAGRTWSQLEWWGLAAKAQRVAQDPLASSPAFLADPSQRNAP
jgi:hypothetical protein